MTLTDLLRFALGALGGHRLRTVLSLLGMAIGVASVVVLTGLGEGARTYVVGQFSQIGSNLVIVIPGKNETTGMVPGITGVPNDLTLADAAAIGRQVPGIVRFAPAAVGTETVSFGEKRRQVAVIGTTHEYFKIRQVGVAAGEVLPPGEIGRGSPVTVLGSETARELFGEENPLDQVVRIGGWRMRVVGVLETTGVQLGVNIDDLVLVPVRTAMKMLNRSSLFRILVEVRHHGELETVKERIVALMADRHGEEDITCLTQDAVVSTFSSILGVLTLALVAIATVSLTVAGIGIMNVTLVSVSERTAEIGLLRAVGVRSRQILAVFLAEAALLSTAGGVLGLAIGWLAIQVMVEVYPAMPARSPPWAVAAAFAVSVVAGLVFGILPARRATRLDPIQALAGR
ncbi:MAG: ABC transporter permease [Thermoanaerobaculia bacterium]